jgi:hypothetical protein
MARVSGARLLIRLVFPLAVLALVRSAAASPCGDPGALRGELERESSRMDHWVLAWRIVYTAGAVGQFAGAASGAADHDNTRSLYVGGAESAIAALGFWFSPLRIHVPAPIGDACADRAALREVSERAADDERDNFWLGHIGGLVINGAGAIVLGEIASWKTGAISFVTGEAVGLISTYTMPRASWGRVRDTAWGASVTVTDHHYGLVVGGLF